MHQVDVNGLRLACERRGSGQPLVLLHGALEDSRSWARQLAYFSRYFDVIAWDAPGCGRSSDPPDTFRLPEYADCLGQFLDNLSVSSAHIIGLSWGSGLAIEFTRRHPERVESLVLASAYAGWAGSLPAQLVAERLEQVLRESERPAQEFVPEWLTGLLTESASPELRAEVSAVMSDFHPAGYRAMARSFAEADLRGALPHIQQPALLLYGELDQRSPPSVGEDLQQRLPNSRLVVLPGVGHLSNIEAADTFNLAVREFLEAVAAGGV